MPLAVIGCWRVTTRPPIRTRPGFALVERRVRHRPEPVERRPVQPDHLAAGVEPDHRVGVADPLDSVRPGSVGASVGGRRRSIGRDAARVNAPPRVDGRRAARASRPRPRGAARGARAAAARASPAPPTRISRSSVSSGRPVRSTTSASDVYGPRASSASSSSSCSSPIPLTSRSPSRTPQPTALSAAQRLAGLARRDHAGRRPDRIGSPLDAGVIGEWLARSVVALPIAQPGRPTHSVVVW